MGIVDFFNGRQNDKELKKIAKIADEIDALASEMSALSDIELQAKTPYFKEKLATGATLDDILVEAFAVVREASTRVLGLRHFHVQLMGGIVLHQGRIAEMKTGEGKTLVATLPVYLNSLDGKGVHVITVNDYLATRDSENLGRLYNWLGLTVGLNVHGKEHEEKQEAYRADVTYGTNNEFGFDYLRDNMVIYKERMVQRDLNYAIIDEVDSILVDEARTPLIISGAGEKSTKLYFVANTFVRTLKRGQDEKQMSKLDSVMQNLGVDDMSPEDKALQGDFTVDEKGKTVVLTEQGVKKAEGFFNIENLADMENAEIQHHINAALKANSIFKKDVDYVVKDGEVIIVDEFTGRLMFGRRYSDGLHQAIEAKEGVKVERENQTLATITFQNYFRMYQKLAGMTGTAKTEENEFKDIYNLDVLVMPTNKPMIRKDEKDSVYKNEAGKFRAVVEEIQELHAQGRPVLVGTISIERSEILATMLKKTGLPHTVLNAKYHEKEAEIISQAGQMGAITISTNMAGRGTDIVLGEGVANIGGLHIIGTERHESRRIDNQLRGRAGRQGDPGSSRFYVSLEDELMRLFGSENIMNMVEKLGMEDDMNIENSMLTKQIENAQKRVEGRNFDIRKNVLQYDDVMNKQREVIYAQRRSVLLDDSINESILSMIKEVINEAVNIYTLNGDLGADWDLEGLRNHMKEMFLPEGKLTVEQMKSMDKAEIIAELEDIAMAKYAEKEQSIPAETMRELEKVVLLQNVDTKWIDHIDAMDQLRDGVGLRAYGQHDPVQAYKMEGYEMFVALTKEIKEDTIKMLYTVRIREDREVERKQIAEEVATSGGDQVVNKPTVNKEAKIGRNDPCPCGSGLKYKKCCGKDL